MEFEWNPSKAISNLAKHGVSFEEASTIFDDPLQMHYPDDLHSIDEQRYYCIGKSVNNRLILLVYAEPQPELIRLVSARLVTKREENLYVSQSDNS